MNGIHCFIFGQVQGVFYRSSTQRKAKELGVTGWVRNLGDGRVEVFAFGDEAKLNALQAWLWQGPSQAKVTQVESVEVPYETHIDFAVI